MGKPVNFLVHLPKWITSAFPDAIWSIPTGEQVVYLTLDDGPVPDVTPQVLDILRQHGIKATFFCVGDNVAKYPELFQQIKDEGHSVGNHTFNHVRGFKSSNSCYLENIEKANILIKSNLFRPPHGTLKKSQYKAVIQKYKLIMWDVISCDYDSRLKPEQCLNNVLNFVRDGSIITFHDSVKAKNNVLAALPQAIDILKERGYQFRKIEFLEKQPIHLEKEENGWLKTKQNINRLQKGA